LREVALKLAQPAPATPDDKCERTVKAIGNRAELRDVPVDPVAPAATGGEFKGEDLDLGALSDETAPAVVIAFGAAVHVQAGREARRRHLRPG
jgi:hypothetical protein